MPARLALPSAHLLVCALLALAACSSTRYAAAPADPEDSPRTSGRVLTARDIDRAAHLGSVEELLAELVPGIHLQTLGDGTMHLQVMGLSNRRYTGSPLYVVDGIPLSHTDGRVGINPRDIERIEVLRDGASIASFGMTGSFGVIYITMKR